MVAALAILCTGTGAAALISAPNSFDAMTYHLPRVMHWQQNRSLSFYPTPILRQLHQSPWAEYAILHLQLLLGSDHLANCVQWISYSGCLLTVSLIAKELGAERRTQLLAALIAASIPMAIAQASGTQTDCVAAFWCSATVFSILSYRRRRQWSTAVTIGASAALAALTKATTGVFVLPFVLGYARDLVRFRDRRSVSQAAVILCLVLAVNAPHWVRNTELYGHPLGPGSEAANDMYKYTNDLHTPQALASNAMRNIALHLNTVSAIDDIVEQTILQAHEVLQIDPSDERTTWTWTSFSMAGSSLYEGTAGNPLHLLLAFIALLAIGAIPRPQRTWIIRYTVSYIFAFLLFCFLLRWQPWNARLHLPLLVIMAPVIAIGLAHLGRKVWVPSVIILIFCSIPYLVFNPTRALCRLPAQWIERYPSLGVISPDRLLLDDPRWKRYFYTQLVHDSYRATVDYVVEQGDSEVGMFLEMNDFEYPYWALLHDAGASNVRLIHLGVDNISQSLYARDREIAPRLAFVRSPEKMPEIAWRGYTYRPVFVAPYSAVYERAP